MKKLVFLILIALILPLFSPIIGSFHMVKKYTYASEDTMQTLHFQEITESTASTENNSKSISLWKGATGSVNFSTEQNMFTIKIPKTFVIEAGTNPIRINLMTDGKIFPLAIDLDGDGRSISRIGYHLYIIPSLI